MVSRCIIIFENSCKTKATYKSFKAILDIFLKWSKLDYDSFLTLEQENLENILQDYVLYQKRRVNDKELNPNSIPDLMTALFKFLKSNRKKFDRDVITQLYPDRIKRGGDRAITDDEIRELSGYGDKRDCALVHVLSATGSRPEALAELKMKNVDDYRDGFTKLILYAGDFKHEYVTFLHPEASDAFNEYLEWRKRNGEKITDESYAFSVNYFEQRISQRMTTSAIQSQLHRLFKNAGIKRKKEGKRYDLATFGGFRKRFFTRLDLNPEISESVIQCLMDHTGYLSGHYRKPVEEEIFREYKKAVNSLIISAEWKLKQELEESKKENVIEKDKRIADLESALKKQEIMLNAVMKKLQ